MKRNALLIFPLLLFAVACSSGVSVTALRTEQMKNPMGLDTTVPHMGWQLATNGQNVMQTAYHILVASSEELLAKDEGDLWDSGVVESGESQWIVYGGKPLGSNERVWWKVKGFTTVGETPWSEVATWSVGLMDESEWEGTWIGMERCAPWDEEVMHSRLSARYLRKEFALEKPVKRATAYIAGLGLYELYINGSRVGEQVLAPSPTDWRKTILYNTFDVTELLASENAIGVALGNGHFFTTRRNTDLYGCDWVTFGFPKLLFNLVLEYEDGTSGKIVSDLSWKMNADGPIRSNNEYDGEEYDARKEFGDWTLVGYDDGEWAVVEEASAPEGTLRGAMAPNMKVLKTVAPVSIEPYGDKYIIDLGQNLTGWVKMKVRGEEGNVITLRFAETLLPDGGLYTDNLRTALATDKYICNGKENGAEWSPTFVFHGFRYVEVDGYANPKLSDFTAEVVSDEMEELGTFSCSSDILNQIYHNCYWGILSNYKGFPVDCPQRDEREPWLGDRGAGVWGESYIFNNGPLYAKWVKDICEAQREDGCIPDVAPAFWVVYSDNVTWPYALPSTCDMLYTRYGNEQVVAHCYPYIKLWLEHLCGAYMTKEHILARDTYGDWCVPPESPELIHSKDPARRTDGALISTAYIVKVLQLLERFALIQGLEDEAVQYRELAKDVADGFNAKYLHADADGAYYDNNTVTANILPLAFGMVPEEYEKVVEESLVKKIMDTNDCHVSCGVIGMQWLLRELSNRGYEDIAWTLATNTSYPSWGYMAENGATTVWELWNGNTADPGMNSGNHVMLIGDLVTWCYENVGGIRSDYSIGNTAFKHIVLQPEFGIDGADWADVSYNTPYGKVVSNWKKAGNQIKWSITVPANTTAEIHLPDGTVENVGSGHYKYKVEK